MTGLGIAGGCFGSGFAGGGLGSILGGNGPAPTNGPSFGANGGAGKANILRFGSGGQSGAFGLS